MKYDIYKSLLFRQANKIGKINLAATGKDLMEDEKQGDFTVDLFAALDMETEAVTERLPELENNQTLGLLNGFLSVDDWYVYEFSSFLKRVVNSSESLVCQSQVNSLLVPGITPISCSSDLRLLIQWLTIRFVVACLG